MQLAAVHLLSISVWVKKILSFRIHSVEARYEDYAGRRLKVLSAFDCDQFDQEFGHAVRAKANYAVFNHLLQDEVEARFLEVGTRRAPLVTRCSALLPG